MAGDGVLLCCSWSRNVFFFRKPPSSRLVYVWVCLFFLMVFWSLAMRLWMGLWMAKKLSWHE